MSGRGPDISEILSLARQAGEVLLSMQGRVAAERKADGSPVTEADRVCNKLLVDGLGRLTPDIPVLAEENAEEDNRRILESSGAFWAVDPLDVTSNYIEGRQDYSVNIALLRERIPVLGALLFPAHGDLFFTGGDGRAYRQRDGGAPRRLEVKSLESVRARPVSLANPITIALRPGTSEHMEAFRQPFIRPVFSAGQRRACMVASGEVLMAQENAGFRLWDSAPSFAIVRAAGGGMRTEDGRQLPFTSLHLPAYTVAHPGLLDRLYPESRNPRRTS